MSTRFSFMRRSSVRRIAASALAGAFMVSSGAVGVANAHDLVVDSNPKNGSTISEPVDKITMEFSGEPKDGFNTVALSRDGQVLFSDEPEKQGRNLTLEVPGNMEWEPGSYTVGYQITSSDGHATRGAVKFDYGEGGEAAAAAEDADAESASTGGAPTWLWAVAGIVVLVGALVLLIAKWRGMKNTEA